MWNVKEWGLFKVTTQSVNASNPPATHHHDPWQWRSFTGQFLWKKCRKIKCNQGQPVILHLFLITFCPLVSPLFTQKIKSTTLSTKTSGQSPGGLCWKFYKQRISPSDKCRYPHTSREAPPPMLHEKSWHQLGRVSPLRGETPALLRQWRLMPPASSLRSRRIRRRTDGHMINIYWSMSEDVDLDQWSFTLYSLLDASWKLTKYAVLFCFFT